MEPYLNLFLRAPRRLEWLRGKARQHGTDWRKERRCGYHDWHSSFGGLSGGREPGGAQIWATFTGPYFRHERFADECEEAPRYVRQNRGWYTDGQDASETARGIVASLPHGRFLSGYYWSANGERVYSSNVFENERDAAIDADAMARIFGETESAYQERYQQAYILRYEIETSLQRLRECIVLRHNACMDYVREEIQTLIEQIRDKRETLATDYADFNE